MSIKSDAIPLFVPSGTSIQLSRKKPNNFGRFQAVGEFSTLDKESKYDLLEAMTELSKGAQRLFTKMVRHRDDANRVLLPRPHKVGTAAYKTKMRLCMEIKTLNLIGQVCQSHVALLELEDESRKGLYLFILNPSYIKCRRQLDAQLYWKAVTRLK